MRESLAHEEERHFTRFDLVDIRPLLQESQHAFLPSKKNPDETLDDLLQHFTADPEFQVLGYKEGEVPASYIMALSDHKHPDSLAIGPMYVGEAHRGKGFGKRQVVDLIEYAKARGCQSIFTKTWGVNAASRAVFESLGFEVEGVKEDDRADGDLTISYLLKLE